MSIRNVIIRLYSKTNAKRTTKDNKDRKGIVVQDTKHQVKISQKYYSQYQDGIR